MPPLYINVAEVAEALAYWTKNDEGIGRRKVWIRFRSGDSTTYCDGHAAAAALQIFGDQFNFAEASVPRYPE